MMSRANDIINELTKIAENPGASIYALKNSGKKLVGVLPVYTPEELIHAAGAVPVGLWGGNVPIAEARAYLQPFACSIMQSVLELELRGTYDVLDAVVIPSLCDTLKCMGQKWKGKCPSIQFTHPQNRAIEAANTFLVAEYEIVRRRLEEILGAKITDDAIAASILVYNANRRALNAFAEEAAKHPDVITPAIRHDVFKSRWFMEKEKHTALVEELTRELAAMPAADWQGMKVILTGITAEPKEMLDIFAELGIAVVGDDLAQESRQTRTLVPEEGGAPLYRMAKMWQDIRGCSLAGDFKKVRGQMLMDMMKAKGADAIVVCMMKFCDPEEFDYAVYNTQFDNAGVKYVMIEIDQEATAFEQIRTRLQGLAEMV